MAVDLESIKWATSTIVETPIYTDEDGVETQITVSNKVPPSTQFKTSGALFEENVPRAYINHMFYSLYKAIEDLETRLSDLES